MKFIIEQAAKACSARIGIIRALERLPNKLYKTPLLLFTEHNLSHEIFETCEFHDFAILLSFDNVEQMINPLNLYGKGISEFIGLKESLTFITCNNTCITTPSGHHEKGSISIHKKSGKLNITPEYYMNFMKAANPDFFCSLADGDTWPGCSKKRVTKANERSEEMFDACIEYHKKFLVANKSCRLIATIEGGFNEYERKKSTQYLKQFDEGISGYFIDGLHRNGGEPTKLEQIQIQEIVKAVLSDLPVDKMKIMLGAYLPIQLLNLIELGIDIFDSSFAILASKMNRAITFNYNLNNPIIVDPEIDLMDAKYKEDFAPFIETCKCLACTQHTKAYTNHLLMTRELLGPMLLVIHNLHHYSKFFEAIQTSIKEEKFTDMIQLINEQYKNSTLCYEPCVSEKVQKKNEKNEKKI